MSDDRSPILHTISTRTEPDEQERLVEEGHRRAHLERTPGQFVLTLSDAGRITHAIGLDTVLGHAPRAWIGQHVEGLLDRRVDADELLATIRRDLAEVGRWTAVQGCVRADGAVVGVQLFATPRVDPATHAPAGCYLSGLLIATDARRDSPAAAIPALVVDRRPVVLVADDDGQMRATLRYILERGGYGVTEASSGREALDAMRSGVRPHFLIADLRMADGSGGWLVSQVAYEFPMLLMRTVVIAGDAAGTAAAHVASRWHCPVLAKPFNGPQLVSTLARLDRASADVA
jgi:two-component system chemotaxis response regulator CheY